MIGGFFSRRPSFITNKVFFSMCFTWKDYSNHAGLPVVFFAFENLRLCLTQATADRDFLILYPHQILYLWPLSVVHKIKKKRERKGKEKEKASTQLALLSLQGEVDHADNSKETIILVLHCLIITPLALCKHQSEGGAPLNAHQEPRSFPSWY